MKKEIESCFKNWVVEGDEASGEISFPPEFSGFQGHFPEQPVLPGVCQIGAAVVLAGRLCGKQQSLVEMVNAKFVAMVQPNQPLRVECRWVGEILKAKLLSEGERVAEFKLRVKDASG